MKKPKLLLLSDLWGWDHAEWSLQYQHELKSSFDVLWYDSCMLGGVDKSCVDQEALHHQFIHGGISTAVAKMKVLEKDPVHILAFSVGGAIAWKYALQTQLALSLTCVSSTRLRKETLKPVCPVTLYFGEHDDYIPPQQWFDQWDVNSNILINQGHEMYRNPEVVSLICKVLKKQILT